LPGGAGATLTNGLTDLETTVSVMPKLFRRLADCYALNDGDPSMAGFSAYLAQRDDRVTILPTGGQMLPRSWPAERSREPPSFADRQPCRCRSR
jgi:hypothetical protein